MRLTLICSNINCGIHWKRKPGVAAESGSQKHQHVYTCGDKSKNVYFIEKGQIKLLMLTSAGKECLLDIYADSDVFGELSLSRSHERMETAMAMEETVIRRIPRSKFFSRLTHDHLLEGFVKYLALRIADRHEVITNLVTIDSEKRLATILLKLALKLGKKHPRSIIIEHKITQSELAEMVGTTRSRVCRFMQKFKQQKLIEMSSNDFIIVKEKNLSKYMSQFD